VAQQLGFIGVGTLGEPMAARLLESGFEVITMAHRRREPVERLLAAGAQEASSPAEVAQAVEIVVTCLPDAPQVEEACFGDHGIAAGAHPGLVLIDTSTISPVSTQQIGKRLHEHGIAMLDAPVSGGPARAATGDLTMMVGGEPEIFERCQPVLQALGSHVVHVGGLGQGEVVKLVNNTLIGVMMIGMSEALTLGVKAGGDAQTIRDVVLASTGANYLLEKWLPNTVLQDQYEPGFAMELMHKDLGAALATGKELGVPMLATALAQQLYATLMAQDHRRDDYTAVSLLYQDAANVTIATGEKRR
jgi:3-hydroxyisobutyrate dehydrogenase